MTYLIIPMFMVVGSVGLFFGYISPGYSRVVELRAEVLNYTAALEKVEQLKELRDELNATYRSYAPEDIDKLFAVLPDSVDNVKLGLDLDTLAEVHKLDLKNISLSNEEPPSPPIDGMGVEQTDVIELRSTLLTFNVTGTYVDMVAFLKDLERNLRLLDIVSISFSSGTADAGKPGSKPPAIGKKEAPSYDITTRIYWLK
jgi:hypothetical protein